MMILYGFGDFRPFWRVQAWAVAHLIPVHCTSGDLRGTIAALALHAFAALEAFAVRQLMALTRNVMVRALQGARFAADMTAADTTVAAGNG
jgi:hypothetical protein